MDYNYNNVDWNNTFINSDEVRGWGIRCLRERHRKEYIKKRDDAYAVALVGAILLTVGACVMMDSFEKAGKCQGVLNTINEVVDKAAFDMAADEGYKILK